MGGGGGGGGGLKFNIYISRFFDILGPAFPNKWPLLTVVPESGLTLLSAQYEKHSIVCVPGGIWVDEEQYDRFEDAGHIASLHSMSDPRLGQGPRGACVRLKAVQHHKHRPEKQNRQSHSKINSRYKLNKLKIKHLFTKFNFVSIVEICHRGRVLTSGLEISWSHEPRAPLISPVAPANFYREPKDYWFLYTTTSRLAFELLLTLAPWLSCTSKKAASRAHYFICANLTSYTILQRINNFAVPFECPDRHPWASLAPLIPGQMPQDGKLLVSLNAGFLEGKTNFL